jgi:predicted regulator of Ras-like GTPase activity (Roadblock/LC7/MglB family)
MNQELTSNSGNSNNIKVILNDIKKLGNLKGVVLAKRNGDLIAENIAENDFDGDTFAAMCASVLESANGLRKNLGAKKVFKIITELESGNIIIIIELDKKSFYSFVLGEESKIEPIINNIDKFNQKLTGKY